MRDPEAELRDRLEQVGLSHHADALIELASPSIRLRTEAVSAPEMLARPPARVWGLEGGVMAIAGSYHNLALRDDGTVVAWGENDAGQLGDGTRKHRRTPVEVRGLADITAIAAGSGHSLALTSAGGVLAWGRNQWGELGDGTQSARYAPVPVHGLERDVIAIAAGHDVSLALTADGSVVGWGLNPALEPGDAHATPIRCPGLDGGIVAIAVGGSERLALTSDGSVLAWGSSPSDLSGTDRVLGPARWGSAPRAVEGLPRPVRFVAAGGSHSVALTAEGGVYAWGQGFFGQLGDGTSENRYPPVRVRGLNAGVRAIAAGNCSFAVKDDGSLLSWGWDYQGCLGDGATAIRPDGATPRRLAPAPVAALPARVAAVSPCLALMEDGSVRAWGGEYLADERGADARLDLGATKLGGRPDLRARSRWPARDGRPLSFVAQIDLAELAPLDRSGLLPRAGLASFFYGAPTQPLDPDVCEVVFSEPGAPLNRREFPDGLADDERYAAVALQPEEELTLPPRPPSFLSAEDEDAYEWRLDELIPGPRHRVLGHPDLVQNEPRSGEGAILLLQIDSDDGGRMTWGDVGRLYYLIRPHELRAKRFEATRCELQSH